MRCDHEIEIVFVPTMIVPDTGAQSMIMLWATVGAIVAVGIGAACFGIIRHRRKEKKKVERQQDNRKP